MNAALAFPTTLFCMDPHRLFISKKTFLLLFLVISNFFVNRPKDGKPMLNLTCLYLAQTLGIILIAMSMPFRILNLDNKITCSS